MTVYVDGTNGSDNAPGTLNNPKRTIVAAYEEVADEPSWHIRVIKNNPFDEPFECPAMVQPEAGKGWVTFDEKEEILAPATAASGTDDKKIVTTGLAAGALRGATAEVLDGFNAGVKRTIPHNTSADIYMAAWTTQPVQQGDSFRVFRPAPGSRLRYEGTEPLVVGCCGPKPERPPGVGRDLGPRVALANTRLELVGTPGVGAGSDQSLLSYAATLGLYGVEITHAEGHPFLELAASQLLCGRGAWDAVEGPDGLTPNPDSWAGWGAWFNDCWPVWNDICGLVTGYVVANKWIAYTGRHELTGAIIKGALRAFGENDAAQPEPPHVAFGRVPPYLPLQGNAWIDMSLASGHPAAVEAANEAIVLIGADTTIDSVKDCIEARGAHVRAMEDLVFNTGVDGVRVHERGEFTKDDIATFTVGTLSGNQISVGNTPATGTFAGVSGSGSFLKDSSADDGSIYRVI